MRVSSSSGWAFLALWGLGACLAASCVLDRTGGIAGEGGGLVGQGGTGLGGFMSMTPCDVPADCGNDSACVSVDCIDGMCVVEFADPGDPCMTDDPAIDTCNGQGTCVECALPGDCVTGMCSDGMQTGGEACVEGACTELPGTMPCDPYVCDVTGVTCLVACSTNNDCAMGFYCEPSTSTCEPPAVDGDPCSVNEGCQSGFCADGVCCNEACGGECRSCVDATTGLGDGVCGPVPPGADPDMECMAGFGCQGDSTCVECGEAPEPTGANCPMICANNCAGGVCVIDCDLDDECRNTTINCPTGYDCDIQCTGNDACRNSQLNCPPAGACNVFCENNNHKCEDSTITCGDGPCTVDCQGGDTCSGTSNVVCGANSCDVTCSNTGEPAVNNGAASCNQVLSNCN